MGRILHNDLLYSLPPPPPPSSFPPHPKPCPRLYYPPASSPAPSFVPLSTNKHHKDYHHHHHHHHHRVAVIVGSVLGGLLGLLLLLALLMCLARRRRSRTPRPASAYGTTQGGATSGGAYSGAAEAGRSSGAGQQTRLGRRESIAFGTARASVAPTTTTSNTVFSSYNYRIASSQTAANSIVAATVLPVHFSSLEDSCESSHPLHSAASVNDHQDMIPPANFPAYA